MRRSPGVSVGPRHGFGGKSTRQLRWTLTTATRMNGRGCDHHHRPRRRVYIRSVSALRTLWRGNHPLADAFWIWAVTVGLCINVTTSVFFIITIMHDWPWVALLLGYGVSLPYNAVAVVGVWRSASRYDGPAIHADLARAATVILMAVLSIT